MNNLGQFFQRYPAGGVVVQIQLHPRGDAFSVGVSLYMKKIADFRQVQVKQPHEIDPNKCIKCGACMEKCKFGAISRK